MPGRGIGATLEWAVTGQGIPWKELSFGARQVVVGERTNIRLYPHLGEFDQAALFKRRLDYEKPLFAWLEHHATHRYDAIVEIGANVGIYTIFFDALIKSEPNDRLRHVYAFEPSRMAYARLLANLEVNAACFVSPFAVAICDRTGFSPFYEPAGHLTNGSLSQGFAAQFSPCIRSCTVVTLAGPVLADIFSAHARVLLRIDAEGSEPQILTAMAPIITRHAPDLLVEVLPRVDERLAHAGCLAGYTKFLLTAGEASPRESFNADSADRDWLFTRFPQGVMKG
jgi:FkbM family methyltransferase